MKRRRATRGEKGGEEWKRGAGGRACSRRVISCPMRKARGRRVARVDSLDWAARRGAGVRVFFQLVLRPRDTSHLSLLLHIVHACHAQLCLTTYCTPFHPTQHTTPHTAKPWVAQTAEDAREMFAARAPSTPTTLPVSSTPASASGTSTNRSTTTKPTFPDRPGSSGRTKHMNVCPTSSAWSPTSSLYGAVGSSCCPMAYQKCLVR